MVDIRRWNMPVIKREVRWLYAQAIWRMIAVLLRGHPDFAGTVLAVVVMVCIMATVSAPGQKTPDPAVASGAVLKDGNAKQDRQIETNRSDIESIYRYIDSGDRALVQHAQTMDAIVMDMSKQVTAMREDGAALRTQVASLGTQLAWILGIVGGLIATKIPNLINPFVDRTRRKTDVQPTQDGQ